MDLWDSFWSALAAFIADNGLVAVAFIVLLRSAAVPIPVPADLLVILVGARAREEQFLLWPAWLVLTISTTVGAAVFYAFVRWIGQGDVSHFGHYVGLTPERFNSAETQLAERGMRAVFVARIVPGLRLAIVAVCGMLRFRWWNFVTAVALGALIYVAACLTIGYIFGDAIVALPFLLVMLVGVFIISRNERSSTASLVLGLGSVELIRWGAYGVLLGLTYPVLRARRLQSTPVGPSTNHMILAVESGE